MEGKPDPGFALADEDFFPLCASLSKILGLRPFHSHNVAVLQMADAPYAAHSAFDGAGNHLVCAHQSIILEEAFRRNRILPVKDAAVILICYSVEDFRGRSTRVTCDDINTCCYTGLSDRLVSH